MGGLRWKASSLCFRAAVLLVLAEWYGTPNGDLTGSLHIPCSCPSQSLGLGLVILFGIYYRLHPALDQSRTAMTQVWVWIAATIVLAIGVGLVHTGHENGDPIAAVGAFAAFGDMLLFGWLLYRSERETAAGRSSVVPAE